MNGWTLGTITLGAILLGRGRADALEQDDDLMQWPASYSAAIQRFAHAISVAEGFGRPDAVPTRLNNPGDLKRSSVPNIGADPQGHLHFRTVADGWEALHRLLYLIVEGRSANFTLDMTIARMGTTYAPGSTSWAANVARELHVPVTTPLAEVLR